MVVTIHDLALLRFPDLGTPVLRRMVRRAAHSVREAARIIVDSESTRRDAIELLGADERRIRVVPLGCDAAFRPGCAEESQERIGRRMHLAAPYVLHVGTLEPRKNLSRLVRAFADARRRLGLPHHLVLAGAPGWSHEGLRRLIDDLGIAPVVHCTGAVACEDLPDLYRGSDVFVYPSLYEGFGLPVLEALACGVPVITSRTSSLPEVAGDAAVLVDPRDETAIGKALEEVLSDQTLRARLRRAGPLQAGPFTWERCARQTLAVYDEAMAARSRSGARSV